MRHALYVPNFRSYADPRRLADLARDAEAAGWEGVFIWDHVWASIGLAPGQPTADAWIAMAAMAAATERILVGPMITPLARRRPWKVARELVTLDHLSGGRVVFGAGLGMPVEEYTAFGEDPDARVRAEKLDEGLAVLGGLLAGEPFSFAGRHYTLRDVHFGPRPVQARIPIWIAGTWPVKPPFRRAVRYDGVIPLGKHAFPTAEELAAVRAFVDQHRDRSRPYDLVAMGFTRDPADVAQVRAARDAGSTWWLESLHDDLAPYETARERVRQGPPQV